MRSSKMHWSRKWEGAFTESQCVIEIGDLPFTGQGAYLLPREPGRDDRLEGVMYIYHRKDGVYVGNWSEKFLTKISDVKKFKGPSGDRRMTFKFKWQGREFTGQWYNRERDVVKVKER